MIHLPNDYSFDFAVASGALGFDGRGWWWEKPLRWLGLIDPHKFLVITKTLTRHPRHGNLRWWCPWRCVRPTAGGFVNAVGLTNPGLDGWFRRYHRNIVKDNLSVAVSIAPETPCDASWMAWKIMSGNSYRLFKAIELNVSCPNTKQPDELVDLVKAMVKAMQPAGLPIIVKLGWTQPYLQICKELDGRVAAFDLINTVPWSYMYPDQPSPLAKYGLEGGLSGEGIGLFAINALGRVIDAGVKTPIISGGGICNIGGVHARFNRGAKAVAFGSVFLRHPTWPNQVVEQFRAT
jgi:dihydroorotate dehydrogenase